MNTISKEHAIELWADFLLSNNVTKDSHYVGPGGGVGSYSLNLWKGNRTVAQVSITAMFKKVLITPYGSFDLDEDEFNALHDSWKNRDVKINIEDLVRLLKA